MRQLIAVDIGGTFTDLIVFEADSGEIGLVKVPTTPADPAVGLDAALRTAEVDLTSVERFFHGTTLGVNTLLEGKGARTGLVTTRGFRDVLEIGRMNWPMYHLHWRKPPAIIPRHLRFEVTERIRADGAVLHELDEQELRAVARRLRDAGVESVAVSFINAYAYPEHEQRAGKILEAELPGTAVTMSHAVTREFREYERTATTAVDALVKPRLSRYLGEIENSLRGAGLRGPLLITRSDGGVMGVPEARRRGVRTLLSGPASGVMGVAALARELNLKQVIAADMGGTSFDAAVVLEYEALLQSATRIENVPLLMPVVEIATIGAGGGSIAWIDASGMLNVGPQSAGADPGPICYQRGGTEPTFTDAAVVTGTLDATGFLGGQLATNADAAYVGIEERIAKPLGLSPIDAASGIVALAEAKTAATLEEITIGKGLDPREFALVAYGGGGPLIANALALRLEIPLVVIPRLPAAFSAWGMLTLDEVHDFSRTRITALDELDAGAVRAEYDALVLDAEAAFEAGGVARPRRRLMHSIDMRYENQEHTLTVRLTEEVLGSASVLTLRELFEDQHSATYGYTIDDRVEVVTFRVRAIAVLEKPAHPPLASAGGDVGDALKGRRAAVHRESGGEQQWPVYDRELLRAGHELQGPSIVEEPSATTLILAGHRALVDVAGNLLIRKETA